MARVIKRVWGWRARRSPSRLTQHSLRRDAERMLDRYSIQQIPSGSRLDDDEWSALTDLYLVVASFSGSDMWRADQAGIGLRMSALTELERLERIARDRGDNSLASDISRVARPLRSEFSV